MRKTVAAIMLAMLVVGSFSFIPNLASGDTKIQKLWVRMRGVITDWGSTPVFGWIGADAKMVNLNGTHHEWARVHAIWSADRRKLNCNDLPGNFTFSFYAARLANCADVKLNYSDPREDLYIAGLWNVIKITTEITMNENGELIDFTRTIESVVLAAYGELHVFSHWTKFVLAIRGIDALRGVVVRHVISYREIRICDVNDDYRVDIRDLVRVSKRLARSRLCTVPGLQSFDFEMDFNYDQKVDIGDLTTIAANIE